MLFKDEVFWSYGKLYRAYVLAHDQQQYKHIFKLGIFQHQIVINLPVKHILKNYKMTTRKINNIHRMIQLFSHHFNVNYCHTKISLIWIMDRKKFLCGRIALWSIISNKENCQILIISWRILFKTGFIIIQILWILPTEIMLSK